MFQPRSRNDTVLDSVSSDYNLFYNPAPPILAILWIILFTPPFYRTPSVAVLVVAPLFHTLPPPPFLVRNYLHLDVTHTLYPPPSTLHLPASTARLCAPSRVPASAALSRVHLPPVCPPFSALGL